MKYGFIGCGNMGGAIAKALAKATTDFAITDRSGKAISLAAEIPCGYLSSQEIAENCERIFLGVKPHMMKDVLAPLRPVLAEKKPLLITMAAGLTMADIREKAQALRYSTGAKFFDPQQQDVFKEADFHLCVDVDAIDFVLRLKKSPDGLDFMERIDI